MVPAKIRKPQGTKKTVPMKRRPIHKHLARKFVHCFVPHKRNDYKPAFLRAGAVSVTAALIIFLFCSASTIDRVLITSNSPQVAAVVAAALVDLANADRTNDGLTTLSIDPTLQKAAQMKADDMASKSYFAHNSPDGHDPWYWFTQAGYSFSYAGENLAVYFSDSSDVNTAWMNSTEHRANILNPNFTAIGIATAQGIYQGQQTVFVVQEFGTPSAIAAASEPALPAALPSATASNSRPQTAAVTTAEPASTVVSAAPLASKRVQPAAVKGASTRSPAARVSSATPSPTPVAVIEETPTFIAVKYIGEPSDHFPQNTAGTTPANPTLTQSLMASALRFATSPQADLVDAYEIIAVIIAMALALEVGIESRRQHPHRIAMGLSLACLMIVLLYAGHALLVGHVTII